MPVVRPENLLPLGPGARGPEQTVIVFDFGEPVGLAVDEIVDIVESDPQAMRSREAVDGVLGSEVMLGKTTLVLDVFGLLKRANNRLLAPANTDAPRRVLVIEDSLMMRSVLVGYLRSGGYDPVALTDADSALEALDAGVRDGTPFSALVTDVEMPGADGLMLTRVVRVHANHARLPVILLSKHDRPQMAQIAASCGVDAFLQTVDRTLLLEAVESAIRGRTRSAA
jgi:CheY-like chemotaxis protein